MPEVHASPAPVVPAKPKSRLAVVLFGIVLVGAVALYFWVRPEHSTSAGNAARAGYTLPLETFVVNLTAPTDRAYLRVGITLALSNPAPKNREEIPVAQIRDVVLSVLSAAQANQLMGAEGKQRLKSEILGALQQRMPQVGVQDVYFTEFLVQM